MEQTWIELFYQETDAGKRQALLMQNSEKDNEAAALFREKLWIARYGKRSPKKDAFVGCLMELKYLSEGSAIDFGGKKRRQAAQIVNMLCLSGLSDQPEECREILLSELTNVFLSFMKISREGRGFTSLVFGMGQLSEEGVTRKIAEQISAIAFRTPHFLHMDKEFALLQEAALLAFRQEYPNREHFLKK